MYQCFSTHSGRRIDTDNYGEACFWHSLGYVVFDWSMVERQCRNSLGKKRVVRRLATRTQGA